MKSRKGLLKLMSEFSKITVCNAKMQKSIAFMYTSNK